MSEQGKALRGSITVFASLSLLLTASFLLVLLEAARVKGLDAYSRMQRVNAMESVFSMYDRELFDRYGIFLLDGSFGSGTLQFSQINGYLQAYSQKNLRPLIPAQAWKNVHNFYQADATDASVTGYLLATDYDGAPFRKMAVESMKAAYPAELAETLYENLRSADQAMAQAQQSQSAMDQAQEDIRAAKEQRAQEAEAEESGETHSQPPPEVSVENPMDVIKALREKDILTLVLPAGSRASVKSIQGAQTLEYRSLLHGNEPWQKEGGWYENVLYQQFLQTHFAYYQNGYSSDGVLDYELEYIQAGKKTDRENLKSVVRQLLLLREGVNFLYLQTDTAKQQEAHGIAMALAAGFGIAPAVEVIAQGILAAWAYAESILDVRALLAGGKVAWMKTAESWSSSLSGLGGLLSGGAQAKHQDNGVDYKGYLQKLLWLKSERALNYRAMDLLELRAGMSSEKTRNMNAMVLALRADFSYVAEPFFSEMVTLQQLRVDQWDFSESAYYSYFSGQ